MNVQRNLLNKNQLKKKSVNRLKVGFTLTVLCLGSIASCKGGIEQNSNSESKTVVKKETDRINQDTLIGVLVWNPKAKVEKTVFLKENLSSQVSCESLESFGKLKWDPFEYSLDYDLLVLRVVDMDSLYFHVCVSEKNNEIRLISRKNKVLNFQSWSDHLLTVFSVDFDNTTNPLHKSIGSIDVNQYEKDEFYHPVSIKGDWLCVEDDHGVQSFIKWCEKGKLLIDISYVA